MDNLDFRINQEEHEALVHVLESYLSDLRFEISNTDTRSVRRDLKGQENVIREILQTLRQPMEEAA